MELFLEVRGQIVSAERVSEEGLFVFNLSPEERPLTCGEYRIYHHNGLLACDPYAFWPTLSDLDLFLFNKGCHYQLYELLGAHIGRWQDVLGVRFAVWAPNAQSVSLIGDFNHWDGRVNPMRSLGISGVWELFVPALLQEEKYKFEIRSKEDLLLVKSDPYGSFFEVRPKTASIVWDLNHYIWRDTEWMAERAQASLSRPIVIYELHLGSWRHLSYLEAAEALADYCQTMGFTHIELLPVMEHPLDESWGYQVTGFFAPTSRYGTPNEFQAFVDHLHRRGIGIFLDWVPAHFPTDDFALARFDGTALYEHADPKKGLHPHWGTAIFNYGRKEVSNFLLASALFWLEKMHIDGLRVDAVASMLYLDYGRMAGEWIPNAEGTHYNSEAIEFLKHLNAVVHERCPGALMMAEESSAYTGVTHSEGLGFDLKWNMGWMNDTLRYFSCDPIYRKFHQNELTFSLLYAFSERFLLPFSHDEVVHMKRSLLSKMPGDEWQRFAQLRLLYSYQICHPGKKLLFMGGEMGQWCEWNADREVEWFLLDYSLHRGMQSLVADLNHFYRAHPALWECDFDWRGYEWIDFSDGDRSIISYLRKGGGESLICVHHFTPEYLPAYRIPLRGARCVIERFNTDASMYGGSGKVHGEEPLSVDAEGFTVQLAPLATMIFSVEL